MALMASSRGECTRSAISSWMRTITLPNCTCAALCSGVPREYAATLWNASVIMLQSSSGNPSHSSVTAPGTGTDSSCVNSHSPLLDELVDEVRRPVLAGRGGALGSPGRWDLPEDAAHRVPVGRVDLLGCQQREAALPQHDRAHLGVGARRREVLPVAERGRDLVVAGDGPEPTVTGAPRDGTLFAGFDPRRVGLCTGHRAEEIEVDTVGSLPGRTSRELEPLVAGGRRRDRTSTYCRTRPRTAGNPRLPGDVVPRYHELQGRDIHGPDRDRLTSSTHASCASVVGSIGCTHRPAGAHSAVIQSTCCSAPQTMLATTEGLPGPVIVKKFGNPSTGRRATSGTLRPGVAEAQSVAPPDVDPVERSGHGVETRWRTR